MVRPLLVFIVLVGILAPAAAGALGSDLDPTDTPTTTPASDPDGDTEHRPDMDPNGLSAPGPAEAFFAWLQQLVGELVGRVQ